MANSSQAQDDLSDIIPGPGAASSPAINPYLVMAAKQEVASGKPLTVGGPVHQFAIAAKAKGLAAPFHTNCATPHDSANDGG